MKKQLLFIALIGMFSAAMAQTVTYNGNGRVYLTDDQLDGNVIEGDTISPNAGTSGYMQFDLGINVRPNEFVKATAVLRSKIELGGFYGDGSSFKMREFKIEGLVKGFKYDIGDLDLEYSKYSLYNHEEGYNDYEASVFKTRREITEYENLNVGHAWRLQGVRLMTELDFAKMFEKAKIDLFASKTLTSTNFSMPDRFLFGGKLCLKQSKNFKLGGSSVTLIDAKNTLKNAAYQYESYVNTGNYKFKKETDAIEFAQYGEFGGSIFKYNDIANDTSNTMEDYFFELGAKLKVKSLNLTADVSYRNVGPGFVSPAAQTKRVNEELYTGLFPEVNKGNSHRGITLFDMYSDPKIYNQTISPTLMAYNPRFTSVSPYGKSTPNRQGFTVDLNFEDKKEIVKADVITDVLQEIVGEGVDEKRKFLAIRGGAVLSVSKLFNIKRVILINGGLSYENTTRDALAIDLTNNKLDLGADIELVKNVSLLAGYKSLKSSGTEYLGVRNEFNYITDYVSYSKADGNVNISESVISIGGKFKLGKYAAFTASAHLIDFSNDDNKNQNYNIAQYYFGYSMKF